MIRYLTFHEINREKWDGCIANSCFETIYPYSWYLDLVSPDWEGLVMGDYEAVFPLTWKKKFGILYIVQPLLTQQLGVFSPHRPTGIIIQSFLRLIPTKYRHVDIFLNSSNEISGQGYKIYNRINHLLDAGRISGDPALTYSTNTRRNVQKAIQHRLVIRKIGVDEYLQLRRESDKKPFKPEHYQWLDKLFSGILSKKSGEIVGAFCDNEICAAVFWAFSKTRAIYLNAASNNTGKEKRAMFLLVDHFIRNHAGEKMIIDFEGSMIPGIARFFKGFGAEETFYQRIIRSSFPLNLKKVK